MEVPRAAPSAASNLLVSQGDVGGSSLKATWMGAGTLGGSITGYRVERFTRSESSPHFGVQETQTVTLRHTPTGGAFTLGFGDVNIALPGTVTAKKGDTYVTTAKRDGR